MPNNTCSLKTLAQLICIPLMFCHFCRSLGFSACKPSPPHSEADSVFSAGNYVAPPRPKPRKQVPDTARSTSLLPDDDSRRQAPPAVPQRLRVQRTYSDAAGEASVESSSNITSKLRKYFSLPRSKSVDPESPVSSKTPSVHRPKPPTPPPQVAAGAGAAPAQWSPSDHDNTRPMCVVSPLRSDATAAALSSEHHYKKEKIYAKFSDIPKDVSKLSVEEVCIL